MARSRLTNTPLSILALIISSITSTIASPTHEILKRGTGLSRGATAGLAIGIAIAGILTIAIAVLLFLHLRQRSSTNRNTHHRQNSDALGHGEKHHSSAATTLNGDQPQTLTKNHDDIEMASQKEMQVQTAVNALPRRQKSLKDHLMGPMYRDSRTDLVSVPQPAYTRRERATAAAAREKTDVELDEEFAAGRENAMQRDTVKSYSSRRATRLMMYM